MNTNPSGKRPGSPGSGQGQGSGPGPVSGTGRSVPPPLPAGSVRTVQVAQGPVQPLPEPDSGNFVLRALGGLFKTLAYTVIPVVMLAAMAAGITYVRLRHGPISFNFVVTPIERGINAELVNNSVKIEGAALYLTSTGTLEFRLRNLTVFDGDGDVIGGSPLAAVNLSAAALWNLRIVPARVELIDPEINLVYTDADGLALDEVVRKRAPAPGAVDDAPRQDRLNPQAAPADQQDTAPSDNQKAAPRQLNIAKMMSEASRRARKRLDATSYLVEFGVRNATINLAYGGKKSSWVVPEASVDFDHARRRSVISGRASVASSRGPWAISFVTDETDKSDRLEVKATVRDLVPSTLAGAAPPLALLQMLDLPVAGDATVELSTSGDVERAQIAIEGGAGRIAHPDLREPFNLKGALLSLGYDGAARTWQLQSSPVKWADGSVLFSGTAKDVAAANQPPAWQVMLEGKEGQIEAHDFGIPPLKVDVWTINGSIVPRRGLIEISEARFTGGGADVALSAVSQPGKSGQNTRAEVAISPMPLATLKALWPRALAPGARSWIGDSVSAATFKGGRVSYRTGDFLQGEAPVAGDSGERLSATFEVSDATFVPLPGHGPD